MKKCPTCEKTFDDNMRFCQVDGTPLVDEAPAQPAAPPAEEAPFDPYATIVGVPKAAVPPSTPPEAPVEPPAASPAGEVILEPAAPAAEETPSSSADAAAGDTAGSSPVEPPDDILDLGGDPLKTMYVSDAEMKEVLGTTGGGAETPVEEIRSDESQVEAQAPTDFGSMSPPPSPFSEPPAPEDAPVPAPPSFLEPEPPSYTEAETQVQQPEPSFQDAPTMYQSEPQFAPPPAPIQQQEWNPPPAPTPEWQDQQIGSNTPFQPPAAGTAGQNKTLAIISMVLGILSICCYTGWLTGIAALITGFMARKKAKEDPANFGGEGMALAGLICGGIFTVVSIVYWIVVVVVYGGMILGGGLR
jgi:hypothetical protein